jgi:hypothetical protein
LQEIKDVFKLSGRGDILHMPKFIADVKAQWKLDAEKASAQLEDMRIKCELLS